jgi:hypothetical protein
MKSDSLPCTVHSLTTAMPVRPCKLIRERNGIRKGDIGFRSADDVIVIFMGLAFTVRVLGTTMTGTDERTGRQSVDQHCNPSHQSFARSRMHEGRSLFASRPVFYLTCSQFNKEAWFVKILSNERPASPPGTPYDERQSVFMDPG